jgi:hypothetical protein
VSVPAECGSEPAHAAAETQSSQTAKPFAEPAVDRRRPGERQRLVRQVREAFVELPTLNLTTRQAMRLFALREDICVRVLSELADEGFVALGSDAQWARRGW